MINDHIETILVVTGLITALAIAQCVAPRRMLRLAFGIATPQPVTLLIGKPLGPADFLDRDIASLCGISAISSPINGCRHC